MPVVLERRGEDVDLRWWRGWRCLGEPERRWRGLGPEDGYGRRGEREGEVDMGRRWRARWRPGEREWWWRGLGVVDGYGRRGKRGARRGVWGEGEADVGRQWHAWLRRGEREWWWRGLAVGVLFGRWGEGAAVRVSGQWLAGCGAAGFAPRSFYPPSLPREVARSHASCRTVGGTWVGGQAPPATLAHPPSGPSPAPLLVWGLGLWRRRVVPAVAPVGEGAAQSPGESVVGVRIRDAEHRSPFQEGRPRRLPVGPRRPDH